MEEDKVSDKKNDPPQKRERSPSFPYLDLDTSIEHLRKIFVAAKMNEVRLADVADAWGMAIKSGSLLRYIAALGQYSLIDTSGGGEHRRIKVSAVGRRILEDDRPGVREKLKSEAALSPSIIRGLYYGEENMPAWGADRPNDSIAESSLKFDLNFGGEAARRFLTVYDAAIRYVVDSSDAKDAVDTAQEKALESGCNEPDSEMPEMQTETLEKTPKPASIEVDPDLNDIDFQKAGKGRIKITAVLDADGLDLLEKQIAAFRMLVN